MLKSKAKIQEEQSSFEGTDSFSVKESFSKHSLFSNTVDQESENPYTRLQTLRQQVRYFSEHGNGRGTISTLLQMKELIENKIGSAKQLQLVFKDLGYAYLSEEEISKALQSFLCRKGLAESRQDYKDKMKAYNVIGNCYKLLRQYRRALINYKKMIQLAWELKNQHYELIAYDKLSLIYYYLGDMERAHYYHERMWKHQVEDSNSQAVRMSKTALDAKRQMANKDIVDKRKEKIEGEKRQKSLIKDVKKIIIHISDDEDQNIPSPRSSSAIGQIRLLPHLKLKPDYQEQVQKSLQTTRSARTFRSGKSQRQLNVYTGNKLSSARPFRYLSHLSPAESYKNLFISLQGRFKYH